MTRIQHFCFTLLALALIITIAAATTGNPDGSRPAPLSTDEQKFQDLLNSVEPSALHDILHEHFKDKYQHGVYQEDKTAMEAVHQQNAEVAKSLIELAKRQAGTSSNGTGIVTTTTAVTTEVTETVSVTSINTPKPPTSETTSTTPTTAPTTQPTTTPTTTSIPTRTPTSTNTAETSTPSSTSPPATTGSASSSSPSQEPSRSSPSSEESVTQSIVYTTTQADGAPSTVTQITVVPADQAAGQTNGVGGTGTNTANASLQTNSASISSHHLGLGVCVGVLGLAVSWTL